MHGQIMMALSRFVLLRNFILMLFVFVVLRITWNVVGVLDASAEKKIVEFLRLVQSERKKDTQITGVASNRKTHQYTLTPGSCNSDREGPLVVAYVHSAPQNVAQRTLIRETWANKTYHGNISMEVFFSTGLVDNHGAQEALEEESKVYRDILQGNHKDDYKNLTYKAVSSLKWILESCRRSKFILKTDDDVFVNVFSFVKHLHDLNRTGQTSGVFFCRLNRRPPVKRRGKWNIPQEVYPRDRYPNFCSGLAFVFSMDVARALYEASHHTPMFWVDDVWLTGMVAAAAKVKITRASSAYELDTENLEIKFLGEKWYQCLFGHLESTTSLNRSFRMWEKLVAIASNQIIPEAKVVVPGNVFSDT